MYNVKDYGAVSSKSVLSTKGIQKAIDECSKNGGGRVLVPSGDYLVGTIYLKDNVEMHLEQGATLWASTDINDYNEIDAYPQNSSSPVNEKWLGKHIVIALEVKNVSLTGQGVIDGRGDYFFGEPITPNWANGYVWRYGFCYPKDEKILRPGQSIVFVECENVVVKDITVRNATCWACLFHGCEKVEVRGVKVYNDRTYGNTDGIDIDCSRYVCVSDCIILTGDDGLTLRCNSRKLKNPKPCEYITISNCVIKASACGVRVGVGVGEIRNVSVRGLVIEDCGYGIMVQTRYSINCNGNLENVNFSDVICERSGVAISVIAPDAGSIKNFTFSNMKFKSYTGIRIESRGAGKVENVALKDVFVEIEKEPSGFVLNERGKDFRGKAPVKIINTTNCELNNVKVICSADDNRWEKNLINDNNLSIKFNECNI